jgi:hypothetical protein
MYILRSNYSNNSMALIQWAHEKALKDVTVVYVDTGWSSEGWLEYVSSCEQVVNNLGFTVVHLNPITPFEDVMEIKGGFPSRQRQWCALHLKGIPFLKWVEETDPEGLASVLLPKCKVDTNFSDISEFIESCEYNGERRVWQPLHDFNRQQRDALLARAQIQPLSHPSLECAPCINSSVLSLRNLAASDIEKTAALEEELESALFPPQDCDGAIGIRAVVEWSKTAPSDRLNYQYGCSASFGCGA